ncbi:MULTISPECIES: hypothetical protein [unclassified Pseudomonas]|uniref:hypothetical protein n=1 Tax=unclassified Pseudomonas TaxID=196821 RepID=UPI0011AF67A7|nr:MULTISPECIES: hypothetical protein [unclassified Pseudomonas]
MGYRTFVMKASFGIGWGAILGGVYIRYMGNGGNWFRPYGGSLLNSAKVSKTLLPQPGQSQSKPPFN